MARSTVANVTVGTHVEVDFVADFAPSKPAYFLDTNILIYAISKSPDHARKAPTARTWLRRTNWGVSTQVLMEFYANARHAKHGLSPTAAQEFVERIAARRAIQAIDKALVLQALDLRHRFYLSHWDAAILCAAKRLGAKTVVSEDMEHGRDYEGVTVMNPFDSATSVEDAQV